MNGSWYDSAVDYIRVVDAGLPRDLPIADRRRAVQRAYPWGERKMHPYKMWCKAQREYLARFVKSDASVPTNHLSPLERMMAKGTQA